MKTCKSTTKINAVMQIKSITQKELHAKIKDICNTQVTLSMLSRIISGKQKNIYVDTLIKICVALEISPNEVLDAEQFKHLFKESFIAERDAESIFE
jgi:DNA-binding Xre family transcriptional regulator